LRQDMKSEGRFLIEGRWAGPDFEFRF
jgi:hypothetical protein